MIENTFVISCTHCGKTNEVSIATRETGFNEWVAFHCAACGLKIDIIRAADTPKTKIISESENPLPAASNGVSGLAALPNTPRGEELNLEILNESSEGKRFFAEISSHYQQLVAGIGKDKAYQILQKSADDGNEMAIRLIKTLRD